MFNNFTNILNHDYVYFSISLDLSNLKLQHKFAIERLNHALDNYKYQPSGITVKYEFWEYLLNISEQQTYFGESKAEILYAIKHGRHLGILSQNIDKNYDDIKWNQELGVQNSISDSDRILLIHIFCNDIENGWIHRVDKPSLNIIPLFIVWKWYVTERRWKARLVRHGSYDEAICRTQNTEKVTLQTTDIFPL